MTKTLRWLASLPWSWFIAAASLVSAYLIWRSKKNVVSTFEDALAVQELRKRIRDDEAQIAKLLLAADKHASAIDEAKLDIRTSQERILWLASPAATASFEDMTDDELSAELTRLGF